MPTQFQTMDDLIDHYQNTDDLIKSFQLSSSGSNNNNNNNKNNNNGITLFVDTIEYEAKVTIVAKHQSSVYLVKIVSTDEDNEDENNEDDENVIKEQEYRAESLLRVTQQVLEELSAVRDEFLEKVLSLFDVVFSFWSFFFKFFFVVVTAYIFFFFVVVVWFFGPL